MHFRDSTEIKVRYSYHLSREYVLDAQSRDSLQTVQTVLQEELFRANPPDGVNIENVCLYLEYQRAIPINVSVDLNLGGEVVTRHRGFRLPNLNSLPLDVADIRPEIRSLLCGLLNLALERQREQAEVAQGRASSIKTALEDYIKVK